MKDAPLGSIKEDGDDSWQRCELSDNVNLEFRISQGSNSQAPRLVAQEEDGHAVLDFTNFTGQIRIPVSSYTKKRPVLDIGSSFVSVGKSGGDPGVQELLCVPRPTRTATDVGSDESKLEKLEEPRSSKIDRQQTPYKRNVSFHPTTSLASSAENSADFSDTMLDPRSKMALAKPAIRSSRLLDTGRPNLPMHLSQRTISQLAVVDASGQNELHRLCGAPSINFRKIQAVADLHPEFAKQPDDDGQLPLHVLGSNSEQLNFTEGQLVAKRAAYLLMEIHPNGLLHLDNEGQMPFTQLIRTWAEWTASQNNIASLSTQSQPHSFASRLQSLHQSIARNLAHSESMESRSSTTISDRSGSSSYLKFPPVMIFDEIRWCFEMLSISIEHLGGMPLGTAQKVRPRLAYSKQRSDREKLAQNVASIPGLLKSVLRLESKEISKEVLESPFIRRMLFCPEAYGPWLAQMMRQKNEPASEIAVNFLSTISKLCVQDFIGTSRKPFPRDEKLFEEAKLAVYECLADYEGMIPSLLVMDQELGDQALATSLIAFIMTRVVSHPHSMMLAAADLKVNVTLIIAFRQAVLFSEDKDVIQFPFVTPKSVLLILFASQLVKRITEGILLIRISRKAARRYLFDGWTLLDYFAIVLAMFMAAVVQEKQNDVRWPLAFSFVMGLLWLKVLGFAKIINEHLATFIIAVTRILFDLRYFFLVFWMFVWMMADMFSVVYQHNDSLECEGDDLEGPASDFCSQRSFDPYLRVYAVVVGDFEFDDYSDDRSVKVLWLCLTLFGAVILLNVLIAIVTLSYSSCQDSSKIIFRRARAQFCATHTSLLDFAIPKSIKFEWSLVFFFTQTARLFVASSYIIAMTWSTLFIASRFLTALSVKNAAGIVVFGILSLIATYTTIVALTNVVLLLVNVCAPNAGLRSASHKVSNAFHHFLVRMAGVNTKDTESYEVVPVSSPEESQLAQVLARLDSLEKSLEDALVRGNSSGNELDDDDDDNDDCDIISTRD